MKHILLLEDDENLNRGISLKLGREGYHVFSAYTMAQAEAIFDGENIDLVISDITLPDGNGLAFGKRVREKSNAVLIYLTAMDQEIDIVNGYDSGADDYITKPFSVNIFTSKVNAFMRRIGNQEEGVYVSGDIEVSVNIMQVKKAGEILKMEVLLDELVNHVLIQIEDEGMGIPEGEVHEIFKRFYRGSNAKETVKEGAGIGLYLARNIIEQQGGTIVAKRKNRNGTIFQMTLPLSDS